MKFSYIIAGAPRSATQFISRLLTSAGVPTHHEIVFGMPGTGIYVRGAIAESSWMAAPYLGAKFLENAKIVHITRDPLSVVSSLQARRFLSDLRPPQVLTYTQWVENYNPRLLQGPGIIKYLKFWLRWNELIEREADLRLRVEEINQKPKKLFQFFGVDPSGNDLYANQKTNHNLDYQKIQKNEIEKTPIAEAFFEKASEYGYNF